MYCDFMTDKQFYKFASTYLNYEDDILDNIFLKVKKLNKEKVYVGIYFNKKFVEPTYLGSLVIDDYVCEYKVNRQNPLNNELIKENGDYPYLHYSEKWRKFLTKNIEKKYGEDKAVEYVENFFDTDLGNMKEYNKLMQIAQINDIELTEGK